MICSIRDWTAKNCIRLSIKLIFIATIVVPEEYKAALIRAVTETLQMVIGLLNQERE